MLVTVDLPLQWFKLFFRELTSEGWVADIFFKFLLWQPSCQNCQCRSPLVTINHARLLYLRALMCRRYRWWNVINALLQILPKFGLNLWVTSHFSSRWVRLNCIPRETNLYWDLPNCELYDYRSPDVSLIPWSEWNFLPLGVVLRKYYVCWQDLHILLP